MCKDNCIPDGTGDGTGASGEYDPAASCEYDPAVCQCREGCAGDEDCEEGCLSNRAAYYYKDRAAGQAAEFKTRYGSAPDYGPEGSYPEYPDGNGAE